MQHADDRYTVTLDASSGRVHQSYQNRDAAELVHVALLSAPDVAFTQHPPTAAWNGDMPHTVGLWTGIPFGVTSTGYSSEHFVTATAAWVAATGATQLTPIEDAPGLDPTWIADPQAQRWMVFSATDETDTSTNRVTVYPAD